MEINVEKLEDNQAKVTVTVDAKDVDKRIAAQYRDIARRNNFPGFRKGKAPRVVIDNAYGRDSIRAMVTEDLVNDTYPLVVEDSGLMVVGQPTFQENMDPCADGQNLTYFFTIGTKPEVDLSSYEPVEIKMPAEKATDKEIDEQVDVLAGYYVKWEDARANTKAKKDSRIEFKLEATDAEGNAFDTISSDSRTYTLGSGLFSEAFDAELVGLKKGDEKEFTLDVDAEDPGALLSPAAGKTVNFKVELIAVKKEIKPEVTDEWVKETLSFESVDELRERLAEQINNQKESALPQMKEERCLEVLRERLEGEAPKAIVDETESSLLQDFFTQLQRQGLTFDNYLAQQGITSDQFRDDVKEQAADVANEELAIEAWARHFEVVCTEDDLQEEFEAAGIKNVKQTIKEWRENGRLHLVREAVVRRKAMEQVLDGAVVSPEED